MNFEPFFRRKKIEDICSEAEYASALHGGMRRTLGVWDLTALGVAAVLGSGAFSTLGNAAATGGPAVIFLFIFTAIACGFSALSYAEFASTIPVSGSAYTYAYAAFGEILAWIIGWDLLMEYSIGNIACAISWSQYFTGLLASHGINIPQYFTMDFLSAYRGHEEIQTLLDAGAILSTLKKQFPLHEAIKGYQAWLEAPKVLNLPIVCDLPALGITAFITWIAFVGIQESKRTSNVLVLLKLFIIFLIIAVGAFYVEPTRWTPFAPQGAKGVLKGVSGVFFTYIGFDAISTTAEECKNPQKDLPRGMIYSLMICTLIYVLLSLVITGMVDYKKLAVGDPLAFVFGQDGVNLPWMARVIEIIAVVAMSTVLLVFQVGQPRIWMAMSRDGLLPPIFSSIHKKYKTPWFSTLVTGLVVAIPSLFMNLTEVTDLTSIGTLFAFTLVCGGVLRMEPQKGSGKSFRAPYINSKYIFPGLLAIIFAIFLWNDPEKIKNFFNIHEELQSGMSTSEAWLQKVPFGLFLIELLFLTFFAIQKNFSLIPLLGLVTCSYLITELGVTNWLRFGVWLIVGFFIYFLYGIKHSHLRRVSDPLRASSENLIQTSTEYTKA